MSGRRPVDRAALSRAIDDLLRATGLDPKRDPDLLETADRVSRLWETEFLAGYTMDPSAILGEPVVGEADPDVVVVGGLRFHSMCPHHLVPYRGVAHVAYLPQGKVVGLSKIPRLVDMYARRLQVQERMTVEIAEAIEKWVQPRGVAVVVEAMHLCMIMRGVQKQHSVAVTSCMLGAFREQQTTRDEFLSLIRKPHNGLG
jgi:GTP cyclohydrolase I